MNLRSAKPISKDDRSDAVVVSFDSVWYEKLRRRSFSAVIRKRVPKSFDPRWLYLHINTPVSAVCGRARIQEVKNISLAEGLEMISSLDIAEEDIREYFGNSDSIGCYVLAKVEIAPRELSTDEIRKHLKYYPPQSFMVLSKHGVRLIDKKTRLNESK